MAATLSVRPDRFSAGSPFTRPPVRLLDAAPIIGKSTVNNKEPHQKKGVATIILHSRRTLTRTAAPIQAGSGDDDSAPSSEMTLENAFKLLGVSEGASFDDILRAKKSALATCKDDQEAIAQVSFNFSLISWVSEVQLDSVCFIQRIQMLDVDYVSDFV